MTEFQRHAPPENETLRQAIYDGELFLLEPGAASRRFVDDARALLEEAFPELDDIRMAHELDNDVFFKRIGAIRRTLFMEERYRQAVLDIVSEQGFDLEQVAFDPAKIRAIAHRGHENPAAAPAYYPHRDTWYAHPQSMITWWIPLDDLDEAETFVFYPERFREVVPNDSEIFDYADWVRDGPSLRIGWQDIDAGKTAPYPGVVGQPEPGRALGFSCRRGQNLIFAGSHFHGTRRQETGRTRFSLDFRIVHLGDHAAGRGAPNVDNRSRGSALSDYARAADQASQTP